MSLEFIRIDRSAAVELEEPPAALPENGFLWIDVQSGTGRQWAEEVRRLTGVEIFEEHLLDTENPNHPSFYDSTADFEYQETLNKMGAAMRALEVAEELEAAVRDVGVGSRDENTADDVASELVQEVVA